MKLLLLLLLFSVVGVAHAQDAVPLPPELRDLHPAPPYFRSIVHGGPLYIGLHVLIVSAFTWSLFAVGRRRLTARAMILCGLPFAFGAVAMWLRIYGLIIASSSPMYEGDIYSAVRAVPYPFYLGVVCSALASLFFGVIYAFNRND